MKWILVFLWLDNGSVGVLTSSHEDMYECFRAREQLILTYGDVNTGLFNPGMQAVCIQNPEEL